VALELGGGVFLQLPVGHSANGARAGEPLVPQPTGGPAVSRVVDGKRLVAVGCDPCSLSHLLECSDAV